MMFQNSNIYNYKLILEAEKKTFLRKNSFQVMQNAALVCSSYISKKFFNKKIIIFCGSGNNGGDGILIAKYLINKKFDVHINFPLGISKKKDAKKALKLLSNKKIIKNKIEYENYDLIIDCIFGVGFNRKLNKKTEIFFNKINKLKKMVISIDLPSGVFSDTGEVCKLAIKADYTLSLHRMKPGQLLLPGKEYCGKVILLNIGLVNIDKKCKLKINIPTRLPPLKLKDHKFSRGLCLVIAGKKLIGASKLASIAASQSALRSGAGLCKILVKETEISFFKPHILEEMILSYKDDKSLTAIIKKTKFDSLIYGCGIENKIVNKELLIFLLKQSFDLVLDATVFSFIQKQKDFFIKLLKNRKCKTILTPHEGEFKRVFKISNNKVNDTLNAAKKTNSVIVFKGNDTVIGTSTGQAYININSPNYLATAGSGDVLAGLIGGFLAQGLSAINSAKLGCYIHSVSAANIGRGLIARDLLDEIPTVIKKMTN